MREFTMKSDKLGSILDDLHQQYILLCRDFFLNQTNVDCSFLLENRQKMQHMYRISDGMHNLIEYFKRQDNLLLLELKQLQHSLLEARINQSIWEHEREAIFCIEEMDGLVKGCLSALSKNSS